MVYGGENGAADAKAGDVAEPPWPTNSVSKLGKGATASIPRASTSLPTTPSARRRWVTQSKIEDCVFESTRNHMRAKQTMLQKATRSQYYEWFSGFLIISNSVFIGYQTERHAYDAASRAAEGLPARSREPTGILMVQALFSFLFTVELLLRWASDGLLRFFQTSDYL